MEDLDANVIVQIKGLKKQKQHNNKYGIIVQHKLHTTSNRYRIRLLEDDDWSTQTTNSKQPLFTNFNNNNEQQQPPPSPFKHLYIKDINLIPLCKIDRSSVHKEGVMTLKSFKAGDLIYSDIPLLQAKGFSLLWKTDSSNQIFRIYQIYKDKLRNNTKRAIFDEIIHYDTNNMVYLDTQRAIHKLSNEPTFKIRYMSDANGESEFEFDKWCKLITKFRLNAIGDTVWYTASKLNHSCRPNAYITANGQVMALRDIGKGNELLISYLERDASLYKYVELRKMEIQRMRGFECKCFRCNNLEPMNFQFDDARNFKCQWCPFDGMVSWNANSSRFFTKCNNLECGKWPSAQHQSKFMLIEKKLSVFLLENTGDLNVSALRMRAKKKMNGIMDDVDDEKGQSDEKSKLSEELKVLLDEGQKYLIQHYLLIALYHRLCQTSLNLRWLRLRYEAMCRIYGGPNECLLRAAADYHRFIPLLTVGDMMTGKIKKTDDEKSIAAVNENQQTMDHLQTHINFIEKALGHHL